MSMPNHLTKFYQRFVETHRDIFAPDITHTITNDGRLLFRGPVTHQPGSTSGTGTHAVVHLDPGLMGLLASLDSSAPDRADAILLSNLGTQLRAIYSRERLGPYAFEIVGTSAILAGEDLGPS